MNRKGIAMHTRRRILLGLLVGGLTGCAEVMKQAWKPQPDLTRDFLVADVFDIAYSKSLKSTQGIGGNLQGADRESGAVSAKVEGVIDLNVTVRPAVRGSKITVRTHVPETHRIRGNFNLIDKWIDAYHAQS
jgi:hypothetical protein